MICAGIVLYQPDIKRLRENIEAVKPQVDLLLLVDNGSLNIQQIQNTIADMDNIELICFGKNLGIAAALNQIAKTAMEKGAQWVLTLDQDSVVSKKLLEIYENHVEDNIGMLTCLIKDRNANIETQQVEELVEVPRCITSGCYLNLVAWKKARGFDEQMFIDYVDFDLCLTLRELGYKINRVNYLGLLHEVGRSKTINFLGQQGVIYNHAPFRRYYRIRNHLYLIKKHRNSVNRWKEYAALAKYILLVLLYEDKKIEKSKEMMRGILDYRKMELSK